MTVLIDTYRNRALDVFIRGLNGDISKMLTIQRPTNLPEAYSSCLEIQNLNFRSIPIHNKNFSNAITVPINQISNNGVQQNTSKPTPLPRASLQQRNIGYSLQYQPSYRVQQPQQTYQQRQNYFITPPGRPAQPKPPVPMSIDESGNTKNINYMNRPTNLNVKPIRERSPDTRPSHHKQQRVFHIEQPAENEYTSHPSRTQLNENIFSTSSSCLWAVTTSINIYEYNTPIVSVKQGNGNIISGTFKIIHKIDLTGYENILTL